MKSKNILLSIILSLIFPSCGFCQITTGLVAFYPFNGNYLDESIKGNHVSQIHAQLTTDRNGNPNKACYFDGVDDYLEIPHQSWINFDYTDPFTISLWIKAPINQNTTPGGSTDNDILSKWKGSSSGSNIPISIRIANSNSAANGRVGGVVSDGLTCASSSAGVFSDPNSRLNDDNWHHVVWMRTPTRIFKLYVDNVLHTQVADPMICSITNDAPLYVGSRNGPNAGSSAFKGGVDDIKIYNRALSENEIRIIFNSCATPIDDLSASNAISLFPNPVLGDEIRIEVSNTDIQIRELALYSSEGKLVQSKQILRNGMSMNISLHGLPKGIYFLHLLSSSGKRLIKRLIKN